MEILEKILEEIDKKADYYETNEQGREHIRMADMIEIEEIIRSHMDDCKTFGFDFNRVKSFDCQCGRHYVNTCNDGWIPVEERLPENGTYLCTLDGELCGIDEPFTGMCGIENGKWDEEGCVIAWQPLPEPYRRPKKEKPPCKEHIMRRFMKVE